MRLLLDEHYAQKIADELRNRGHDAVSVTERGDLCGVGDRELLRLASGEGRALLTENIADFMPFVREAAAGGEGHFGVVFTSPRPMPRSAATIGLFVEQLERFLRDRGADDALADQVHWLTP